MYSRSLIGTFSDKSDWSRIFSAWADSFRPIRQVAIRRVARHFKDSSHCALWYSRMASLSSPIVLIGLGFLKRKIRTIHSYSPFR